MRKLEIKENILFQLDMCWKLYLYHTDNIEESLSIKAVCEMAVSR